MLGPAAVRRVPGHRGRPFGDLLARVGPQAPALVVDLGCGPGELTVGPRRALAAGPGGRGRLLAADARPGRASSRRRAAGSSGCEADVADLAAAGRAVDLLVTNATLQWVPGHLRPAAALGRGAGARAAGSRCRCRATSTRRRTRCMREVAAPQPAPPSCAACCAALGGRRPRRPTPRLLAGLGSTSTCGRRRTCTCWTPRARRTPVLEWVRGHRSAAGARRSSTDERERARFLGELRAAARAAYPRQPFGTVCPFRRIFAVAQRSGGTA